MQSSRRPLFQGVFALLMLLSLQAMPLQAGIDIARTMTQQQIKTGIEWCFTARDVSFAEVLRDSCQLRPLGPRDYRHGFEQRTAWLHFRLRNSSDESVERWIEVGHPRMSRVELHYQVAQAPSSTSAVGLSVPRALRNSVGQHYDVNVVTLPANSEAEVWIRVQSDAQMALETVVWNPDAFRERRQSVDMWLALAIGAMLLSIAYSLAAFLASREPFYVMFLLVLLGESIIETVRTGFLGRHLWPSDLAVPISLMAIGSMLATIGLISYSFRMLPSLSSNALIRRAVLALVGAIVLFQAYAIFIDYGWGTTIWSSLFAPLTLILGWLSFKDWRKGEHVAQWIFVSVALLMVIGLLRLPAVMQLFPHYLNDVISPLSTMVVILVVVFSLVDRERVTRRGLDLSKAAAAAQVTFLARMSHELRTPLDIVLGNAQLMLRAIRSPTRRSASDSVTELKSILESGRHLLGLVDEILDYARGRSGELKLRREPVDLRRFLVSIDHGARVLAARNRNQFEVTCDAIGNADAALNVTFDPGRVRQVLDNLLSNAARHTHDGHIRLFCRADLHEANQCRLYFEVSDTGEGIAAEDQERIFQPFERLSQSAGHGGKGVGMGLAVARQLVELMGGQILLRSAPGAGACFSFEITVDAATDPVPMTATNRESMQDVTGYEGVRRTILVVDDDATSRGMIATLLREVGFETEELASGVDARARLAAPPRPDLVVTDQFMPDGDGWSVLQAIERDAPGTPCLVVSAAPPSSPDSLHKGRQFSAAFLKPLDHDAFLNCVGRVLDLQWTRRAQPVTQGSESVIVPEASELAALTGMLELGEITAIAEWASRLRQRRVEHARFADRVEDAVVDLDFEALSRLSRGDVS